MKFQKVRTKSTISNFQNCFLNSYLAISLWTTWLLRELMELVLDRKFKAPNVKIIKFDNFRKVRALGPTQLLLLEITLFSKKASHKIEKQFSQKIWYFVKIMFWKLMIWLCYFWKKSFLFWVWPMETPLLHKLGQKTVIFSGFSKKNFWTNGFKLKFSILIEFLP